jgi:hypothetical protein
MTSQSLSATRVAVSTSAPAGSGTFVRIALGTTSNVVADGSPDQGVAVTNGVVVGSGELEAFGTEVAEALGDVLTPIVCGPVWRQ